MRFYRLPEIILAASCTLLWSTVSVAAQMTARDKYPEEALRLKQQGKNVARLTVSEHGAVTACTITESSGSPSLDAHTCEIAMKRVRFEPALDAKNQPVKSTFMLPVKYVLPAK